MRAPGRPIRGLRASLALAGPRGTRGQLVVALLCALLGLGLAVQVSSVRESEGLSGAREEDLVRILDDLAAREQRLARELDTLREAQQRVAADSGDQAALAEAQRRAQVLGVLAGTVPAVGPGVVVELRDPLGQLRAEVLLDVVEELRNAGAEAIALGPVRVVADTYLLDADGGIEVDGRVLAPPYVVSVVGDPATLGPALAIRGGVVDTVARQDGAAAVVTESERVEITALAAAEPPEVARPVP